MRINRRPVLGLVLAVAGHVAPTGCPTSGDDPAGRNGGNDSGADPGVDRIVTPRPVWPTSTTDAISTASLWTSSSISWRSRRIRVSSRCSSPGVRLARHEEQSLRHPRAKYGSGIRLHDLGDEHFRERSTAPGVDLRSDQIRSIDQIDQIVGAGAAGRSRARPAVGAQRRRQGVPGLRADMLGKAWLMKYQLSAASCWVSTRAARGERAAPDLAGCGQGGRVYVADAVRREINSTTSS